MKVRRPLLLLLVPVSILMTSGCSQLFGNPSSPSTSSSSSTSSTTDTFSGSLAPSGSLVFTFSVATAANVAITLASVSPAASGPLGLGVGPSSNGSCTIANSTSGAIVSASAQLTTTENPGNYCVTVSDAGTLTTTSNV